MLTLLFRYPRHRLFVPYNHLTRSRLYRHSCFAPKFVHTTPMASDQATAPAAASASAPTQVSGTPAGTHKDPVTGELISKQYVPSMLRNIDANSHPKGSSSVAKSSEKRKPRRLNEPLLLPQLPSLLQKLVLRHPLQPRMT